MVVDVSFGNDVFSELARSWFGCAVLSLFLLLWSQMASDVASPRFHHRALKTPRSHLVSLIAK